MSPVSCSPAPRPASPAQAEAGSAGMDQSNNDAPNSRYRIRHPARRGTAPVGFATVVAGRPSPYRRLDQPGTRLPLRYLSLGIAFSRQLLAYAIQRSQPKNHVARETGVGPQTTRCFTPSSMADIVNRKVNVQRSRRACDAVMTELTVKPTLRFETAAAVSLPTLPQGCGS